jgi:hypothetical protein
MSFIGAFPTKLAMVSATRPFPFRMSDDMMGTGIVGWLAFQQPLLELTEGMLRRFRQEYHRLG